MSLRFGTCSRVPRSMSHDVSLDRFSSCINNYNLLELDSWYYTSPCKEDIASFSAALPLDVEFICIAPRALSHIKAQDSGGVPHPSFLSPVVFNRFIECLAPIRNHVFAILLVLENMDWHMIPGRGFFFQRLETFLKAVPKDILLTIECQNPSWIDATWFDLLRDGGAFPVISDHSDSPPFFDLYAPYLESTGHTVILRLIGSGPIGNTTSVADYKTCPIVPKTYLPKIASLIDILVFSGRTVRVIVDEAYEGSASETIIRLKSMVSPDTLFFMDS